ncbi:uncharacterized protein LOC109504413 isoform X2 [Harpegnathos saltator]|uniref:uncharacterized protein LOC109504413 isoform X2 n=1 Tax=Harpegnathos saltator TaxID=610380 RepID=UPI000DBED255|nr:uncharacterized protein LOC109504413 isoform X2 [Harpegnathos saltator]
MWTYSSAANDRRMHSISDNCGNINRKFKIATCRLAKMTHPKRLIVTNGIHLRRLKYANRIGLVRKGISPANRVERFADDTDENEGKHFDKQIHAVLGRNKVRQLKTILFNSSSIHLYYFE